MDNMEYVN